MRIGAALLVLGLLISAPMGSSTKAQTIEERAQTCAACHGEDGRPKMPEVPIIWGQHAGYMYIQLRDFKSGSRKSDIMQPLVADLERADMLALADYFAKKEWPRLGFTASDSDQKIGKQTNGAGMCIECHLGGFLGDGTIARLAGQTSTYLERTMLAFKTRERANSPDKSTLLASFADDELKAMARYLAAQ
jgi:cytochrome c553